MIIVRPERLLAAAAAAIGCVAWIAFLRADLVLSHYDAKAHLVVARRVIDSLTPGWQQIGAVWLPLPHLIHLFPMQVDAFYRTGLFASLVSIACFGLTAFAAARLVMLITGSALGATVAAALLALNPNLLYLQATPMTEPMLLAATFMAVLALYEWVRGSRDEVPMRLGIVLFAAMWTRYEAWPILGTAIPASLYVSRRLGTDPHVLLLRAWQLAVWPLAAVLVFLIDSRITTGAWFVTGGFYVPDPFYEGQVLRSLAAVWWGTEQLTSRVPTLVALAVAVVLVIRALGRRGDGALLVPVALLAAAALPFYAFYEGHPFRIRYMIPTVAACALFGGLGVGMLRRVRADPKVGPYTLSLRHVGTVLAGLLLGMSLIQSPPWQQDAPMLLEAQWDRPASDGRRAVTACLAAEYRGEKVLASMGSLAHYMQELSHEGLDIADFVHEGNGAIWELALETGPAPHVGWMLVDEQAEGGDVLAQRLRRDPAFARGMTRVCEGGGVALYRRAR
ncbi:MAG: hypothetical protein HY657_00240 [Acidobacteria bacterium]|nr:hypothetical protein [Acidobacteriota bacterium]